MEMLNLSHVSKSFGKNKILNDLSFSVGEHSIFGFIGQNGAGKTTTMKLILGLLRADSGSLSIHGEKVSFGQNKTNRFIGYLPDVPEFYGFMTPMEYLTLCGEITGMEKKDIKSRSGELLELVGLSKAEKRIQGFSRGMKQRLGIAQALLNRPPLLICDEPTSALDPAGRKEILDILSSVKGETTVLFSTHILSDVERICDEIAFLHNGAVALQGTIDQVKHMRKASGFQVEFLNGRDAELFFSKHPESVRWGKTGLRFEGKDEKEMLSLMSYLAKKGIPVQRIELLEPTLEALFMEVVGQ